LTLAEAFSYLIFPVSIGTVFGFWVNAACVPTSYGGDCSLASPIIAGHYHVARTLLVKFGATEGLRTLDALQLAIVLDLKQLGEVSLMVTADQRLSRVAPLAGCLAVNPEQPGPVLI
jgi:hypothetical protein